MGIISLKIISYICFAFTGFQCAFLYIAFKSYLGQQSPTVTDHSPSLLKHQPCWSPFCCLNTPKHSPSSGLLSNLFLDWKDCPPPFCPFTGRRIIPNSKSQLDCHPSWAYWLPISDPCLFLSWKLSFIIIIIISVKYLDIFLLFKNCFWSVFPMIM